MEAEKKNQKKLTVAIRAARPEDLAAMRHICLATSTEQAREKKALGDAFLLAFCDYYARAETEHCFVAVNEKDVPIGYILCAPSFERWEKGVRENECKQGSFLARTIAKTIVKGEADSMRPFADRYPAHLHIDLLPECQRMGLGTRLMDTLISHLRELGIPGVMLGVAGDNEKGINFYRCYGFSELDRDKAQILMGISCQKGGF